MGTVAFVTLGCKVNQAESESMAGLFRRRGYRTEPGGRGADVIVVNTCSVTHLGERKSRQMIRKAVRENPGAVVVVTGCFAQLSPAEVGAMKGVDVVIGTQDRHRIVELVETAVQGRQAVFDVHEIGRDALFEDIPVAEGTVRTRAFLKIQEGCENFCSYCIIPYARGPFRSRSLESIHREATQLGAMGFREVVLTGINLGAYGRETGGSGLVEAVRTVLSVPSIDRIRLSSIESLELGDDLIDLLAGESRVCPHLHLPLQSGEDTVLSAMNRPYTADDFKALAAKVRSRVPMLALTTDIIVGFPGETRELFEETLRFAGEMNFAKIHVFPYSKRQGTPAALFPGQIDEAEKKRRVQRLAELSNESGETFRRRHVGLNVPVLVETVGDRFAEGLTSNYLRVYVENVNNGTETIANRMIQVQLTGLFRDGLIGQVKK
jgi:threonylcarbamoyladenosine tRNA methylthiotransferase MtaB